MLHNQTHIPVIPGSVLGVYCLTFTTCTTRRLFNFLRLFVFLFVCSPAEIPRSEVCEAMEARHYLPPPCVSHNGFLFKTGSMARAITERKAREGIHLYTRYPTVIKNTKKWIHCVFVEPFSKQSLVVLQKLASLLATQYSKHTKRLSVDAICIIMLGKSLFVPPCRVQSSLVHAEWWHFQLLWEWQELEP